MFAIAGHVRMSQPGTGTCVRALRLFLGALNVLILLRLEHAIMVCLPRGEDVCSMIAKAFEKLIGRRKC